MAEFPALPLFTDAWIADTKHLSRSARGLYFDLLVLMWRTPGCRVPNDDGWLAVRLQMTPEEVSRELTPIVADFCQRSGNWIKQKRLSREFEYMRQRNEKQSVRAKARWAKEKDISQRSTTSGNAPHPTHTPPHQEKKQESTGVGAGRVFPFGVGMGRGRGVGNGSGQERVTISDPKVRLGRFMNKLAQAIQAEQLWTSRDYGWSVVLMATDANAPGHQKALEHCRRAAVTLGKGWPRLWPTDGKFFEGKSQ